MKYLLKILTVILLFNLAPQNNHAQTQFEDIHGNPFYLLEDDSLRIDSIQPLKSVQRNVLPRFEYVFFKPTDHRLDLVGHVDSIAFVDTVTFNHRLDSLLHIPLKRADSLLYASNSLVLPLIYVGRDIQEVWNGTLKLSESLYPEKKSFFYVDTTKNTSAEFFVAELRSDARRYIANQHMNLYTTTLDRLPQLSTFMSRPIQRKRLQKLDVYDDKIVLNSNKIEYQTVKPVYWIKKANAMLQFTQNYVSTNWHQGGSNNLAFLSTFLAEFNYNNRKSVSWDNKIEWRNGFSSVEGDTLRKMNINDDMLRYNTKFGIKAGGNWYYSVSGEISTPLFDNYKKINSEEFKARLLTPVRATVGVGMDYKYKQLVSVMIAPITLKYVYVNDTVNVNQNMFGVEKGENQLKQIGSSMLVQFNYSPMMNWSITSRLNFYTDYEKIETDWEIVNNFTINRFLSARLLLNPRYDNTAILKEGEKRVRIQFKELLSFGFSYRFF